LMINEICNLISVKGVGVVLCRGKAPHG